MKIPIKYPLFRFTNNNTMFYSHVYFFFQDGAQFVHGMGDIEFASSMLHRVNGVYYWLGNVFGINLISDI